MYNDTDSTIYRIQTEDVYKDMAPDVDQLFSTSNYSPPHPPPDQEFR